VFWLVSQSRHISAIFVGTCRWISLAAASGNDRCCLLCVAGGSTLYIESSLTKPLQQPSSSDEGKESTPGGQLHVTGHLGDVMKESAQIAHTVAKTFLSQVDPQNDFLQRAHIHVHVPEVSVTFHQLYMSIFIHK